MTPLQTLAQSARDQVRIPAIRVCQNTPGPTERLDPISCRDWAQQIRSDPFGRGYQNRRTAPG